MGGFPLANGRKAFERGMKRVLKHIHRTGTLPELNDESKEWLYHCAAEQDYIRGLVAQRMISGRIVFEQSAPRLSLTKQGLNFCWKPIPWESGMNIALGLVTFVSVTLNIVQALR